MHVASCVGQPVKLGTEAAQQPSSTATARDRHVGRIAHVGTRFRLKTAKAANPEGLAASAFRTLCTLLAASVSQ